MASKQASESVQRHESLRKAKMKSMLMDLEADPNLARALLVALGCFFLLIGFPFYGVWVSLGLAALVGIVAYRAAPIGTILSLVLAFPAVAYQTPLFAWLFTLAITVTLFESFQSWYIISMLAVLIMAPFAPAPFNLVGGIVIPVMALASLYAGSRRSLSISLPAVFFILLLSTVWGVQNNAFMPVRDIAQNYPQENDYLMHNLKPEVPLRELPQTAFESMGGLLGQRAVEGLNPAIAMIMGNSFKLLFADTALLQIAYWAVALFLVAWLPPRLKGVSARSGQLLSSLALFIAAGGYYFVAQEAGQIFDQAVFAYVIGTVALVGVLERGNVGVSRELAVMKREKTGKFGRLGIEDLSTSAGVESLADVGGYEDVKDELMETIVWPMKRKELAIAYGIKPPNGILLFGPPGTGKTMLMRALAKELDVGFYYVKCSELLSQWYGESEKNVTELFNIARKNAPCILFFDEIDAIGKKREMYSADDVAPRIMSLFLQEMDGFKTRADVIVIGATNVPQMLDSALLRPGRVDKIIYMHLPDTKAREEIFHVHAAKMPLDENVDFEKLAQITERYSGADIANICTEAARQAARTAAKTNEIEPVAMEDFKKVIKSMKPSVSIAALEDYDRFRVDFERRTGGFKEPEEDVEKKARKITWKDVVGLDDVRQALLEAIEIPLLHEELMKQYKITPSKGLLLFGPPGCGKTMIVKAAAGELNATFLQMSGADLLKRGYGEAVQVIKETFNRAKENAPALIFIDEVESIAPARGMYSSQISENIVAQLLNEMDGVKELKNVMLIGATNKPAMIDPALLRPGRFDKIMYIPAPDGRARKEIFKNNLGGMDLMDVDLDALAQKAEGFSGADIVSVCQEAKMEMVRGRIKGVQPQLSMALFNDIIRGRRPSITREQMLEYDKFMREYGERR